MLADSAARLNPSAVVVCDNKILVPAGPTNPCIELHEGHTVHALVSTFGQCWGWNRAKPAYNVQGITSNPHRPSPQGASRGSRQGRETMRPALAQTERNARRPRGADLVRLSDARLDAHDLARNSFPAHAQRALRPKVP
jgi:hypothetical protein